MGIQEWLHEQELGQEETGGACGVCGFPLQSRLGPSWTVLLHFGQATQVPQENTCLRGPKGVWHRQLSPGGSVTGCSAGGVAGTLKAILAKWLSGLTLWVGLSY